MSFRSAGERLDRRYRRVTVWLLVITVAGFGSSALLWRANEARIQEGKRITLSASRDAAMTTSALCALRHDLERRVATGKAFLREHPDGIAGIPAKTLRDALANQQRTIDALSGITCPK